MRREEWFSREKGWRREGEFSVMQRFGDTKWLGRGMEMVKTNPAHRWSWSEVRSLEGRGGGGGAAKAMARAKSKRRQGWMGDMRDADGFDGQTGLE